MPEIIACRPGWFDTMGWIQRDVPEPWVGWSRSGHFLLVDLTGNWFILNCFCASLLLWTEVSCLHNVFSELCLQSRAGCIPLLSSSPMWPRRSGILLLPTLASCVPWKLYLLCLLKKHIFTTDSTPEPIKLRQRELFCSASCTTASRMTS